LRRVTLTNWGKEAFASLEVPVPFADVGGLKIFYRTGGKGEAVLLLHGITTYSFLWKDVTPLLEENFTFFAPDLLGCGDSSKPGDEDYSLSAQADIILGFMENVGIARAHLVGHDIGGGVAQILAVRDPERFLSLTLVNSVGYDYWPVQPIVSMRVPLLKHLAMAAFDRGVLRMLVQRTFHHKEKVDADLIAEFMRPLQTAEGKAGFFALARALDNTQVLKVVDELPGLPMPVLIVRGDKDIYLKPIISERLHSEMPGSRYEVIDTAGHYSPLDEPRRVAELLLAHLGAGVTDAA
jgi:pimeloyl-ACP methyl ester carboxylesterase